MKPVVRYIDLGFCVPGCPADVVPYDHPNKALNRTWARTSTVLRLVWSPDGPEFETLYTKYVPFPSERDVREVKAGEPAKLS